MSWFGRLFGSPPPPPPTPPPVNTVVIPDELAATLQRPDTTLEDRVLGILREYVEISGRPAPVQQRMPFWLEREENTGDLEEALRDKVTQRRATEDTP